MARWAFLGSVLLVPAPCACAPEVASAPASPTASATAAAAPLPVAATPDIDLRERDRALARGRLVEFDGVAEGLAWPSLEKALSSGHSPGGGVTIQADRAVRVLDVLRAAWAARDGVVLVQTPDAAGVLSVEPLGPKGPRPPDAAACHLAVFLRPDGSLRVAAPGGATEIAGDQAVDVLVRSLEAERASCPIRYVAFGAESDDAPWGPVFDVIAAVDRDKSAGSGARYVLGQATHAKPPLAGAR